MGTTVASGDDTNSIKEDICKYKEYYLIFNKLKYLLKKIYSRNIWNL